MPRGGTGRGAQTGDGASSTGEIVIAADAAAYREGLTLRADRLREQLASATGSEAVKLRRRLAIVEDAAAKENFDISFTSHRRKLVDAESALTVFLVRFAPGERWEAQYALRTGDLELVAAAVRDAAAGVQDHKEAANNAAAEVLIRLGNLAAAGFAFDLSERLLRSGITQFREKAVQARALAALAEMLRTDDRMREANEVEDRQAEVLRQQSDTPLTQGR